MRTVPIKRHPERAVPDEAARILAAGLVAHVGYVRDGLPVVIPLTYHYETEAPDRIYLHGAKAGDTLSALAAGTPVCVTVTMVDGLVMSRTADAHSVNYRCVVCYGTAAPIDDQEEKSALFERMIARYIPGRAVGRDYAAPSAGKLLGTEVVAVTITSWSAKERRGGPLGALDADPGAPGTCGVIELGAGG